jgi:SH3-like domain-containing protein
MKINKLKLFTLTKLARVILLSAAVAGSVCLTGCDGDDGAGNYVWVSKTANVYAKLDSRSEIIMQVNKGKRLEVLRSSDVWCEVSVDGKIGFVEKKNVKSKTERRGRIFILGCE